MAAVLACGPTALLSHRDAAALWGLQRPGRHAGIDVTTARRCRRRPGIVLHRSRRIHADDRAVSDGIPVTSVARTVLDLAEVVRPWRLARAIEEGERRGQLDLGAVERLIARGRGRHGVRPLKAALADYRPVPFTRSELERRFIELCRSARLPEPAANLWIAGGEADMSWPERRLVVELDTTAHHGTQAAFERDRERDTTLQLAGYRVLRVTDRRLDAQPHKVLAAVRALLEL
jgi:very-short-patch-repair endonuclease